MDLFVAFYFYRKMGVPSTPRLSNGRTLDFRGLRSAARLFVSCLTASDPFQSCGGRKEEEPCPLTQVSLLLLRLFLIRRHSFLRLPRIASI